eukprot:2902309-Pyramimonas_sp.AAC.1
MPGKYLANHDRWYQYLYLECPDEAWTDADHARCNRILELASGGTVIWGSFVIEWASTPECCGTICWTSRSDACAAIAIASWPGLGLLIGRRVEGCRLWLQEKVRRGDITFTK